MAKKRAAAKKPPARKKGPAARKQTRRQVSKVLDAGPIRKPKAPPTPPTRVKDRPLPGLEDVRTYSAALLRIMDSMADHMERVNSDQQTLKGLRQNALEQMKRDNKTVAKAHGIELVRVPGEEKVRARLVAGEGASDEAEDTENETDDLDNGEGEDGSTDLGGGESLADA